jgi:hypothetical protein
VAINIKNKANINGTLLGIIVNNNTTEIMDPKNEMK